MQSSANVTPTTIQEPWQLKMFRRTLKKQQKLQALLDMIGDTTDKRCLLVTCGDNNGALNWHFKQHGGTWSWADAEKDSIAQISKLTGDPVIAIDKAAPALPFGDGEFDIVMTIDVHEHLEDTTTINRELARVVKSAGRVVVTTPNGDQNKLANRIKQLTGMNPEDYGHIVAGYDIPELEQQLTTAGLRPYDSSSYSRFFTEMLELAINFAYVKVLSKRSSAKVDKGQIAPQNQDQLQSVEKTYKMYSLAYPALWAISKLDTLIAFTRGYAVIVAARKG